MWVSHQERFDRYAEFVAYITAYFSNLSIAVNLNLNKLLGFLTAEETITANSDSYWKPGHENVGHLFKTIFGRGINYAEM